MPKAWMLVALLALRLFAEGVNASNDTVAQTEIEQERVIPAAIIQLWSECLSWADCNSDLDAVDL